MNKYMKRVNELVKYLMDNNKGRYFGSVIVKNWVIVSEGYNTVTYDNDHTRHGEINAIKNAYKNRLNNRNEDALRLIELDRKECIKVQQMWIDKDDKIEY